MPRPIGLTRVGLGNCVKASGGFEAGQGQLRCFSPFSTVILPSAVHSADACPALLWVRAMAHSGWWVQHASLPSGSFMSALRGMGTPDSYCRVPCAVVVAEMGYLGDKKRSLKSRHDLSVEAPQGERAGKWQESGHIEGPERSRLGSLEHEPAQGTGVSPQRSRSREHLMENKEQRGLD